MAEDDSSRSPESFDAQKPKKRRLHGACDTCRKRKIKCDSATMPGNFCSNCRTANIQCTHDLPRQPKKKETQQAYINDMEDRIDRMERYLKSLHPEKDIDQIIGIANEHSRHTSESAQSQPSLLNTAPAVAGSSTSFTDLKYPVPPLSSKRASRLSPHFTENEAPEEEDVLDAALAEHLKQLSLRDNMFFGPASELMFAESALSLRKEMTGAPQVEATAHNGRDFPSIRPWELEFVTNPQPVYEFPEYDLLQSLVSLYFKRPNIFLPVLHKPTFLKSLAAGQHLWDSGFGMTVLMVCAMGSRYSNDRRVLREGDDGWSSAGWKWFSQIQIHHNSLLLRTSVYDLQYYSLAVTFLLGTNVSPTAWGFIGLGIRSALENGLHRRRGKNASPSAEYEHLKRAFWCLICVDRLISSALGRPPSLADEDCDVDYPIECDDEYWETEDPEQAFKQPPGKPCQLSAFICHIKLCEILAFTVRTLYSTKKSKMLTGMTGPEWEQRLVAELDSSLDMWKDSLPIFLQWHAAMPDNNFFQQSSCLHATYYYIRIQIHRPFLTRDSPLTDTAFTMCTSAARSYCHVLEITTFRGISAYPNYLTTAFSSAIVMMMNIWRAHWRGIQIDQAKDMENIQQCLRVLKECGKRWSWAGQLYELLNQVSTVQQDIRSTVIPKRRSDDFIPIASSSKSQLPPTMPIDVGPSMSWSHLAEEATAPLTMAQQGYTYSSRPGTSTGSLTRRSGISTPSGSVQLEPQQQHLATANAMHFPQMDMYSSASSMHPNDWDFVNNVLGQSQQQRYAANSGPTAHPRSGHTADTGAFLDGSQRRSRPQSFISPDPTSHVSQYHGVPIVPGNPSRPSSIAQNPTQMAYPDDVFAVWSDRSVPSRQEEWDSYQGGMFDRPPNQQR